MPGGSFVIITDTTTTESWPSARSALCMVRTPPSM